MARRSRLTKRHRGDRVGSRGGRLGASPSGAADRFGPAAADQSGAERRRLRRCVLTAACVYALRQVTRTATWAAAGASGGGPSRPTAVMARCRRRTRTAAPPRQTSSGESDDRASDGSPSPASPNNSISDGGAWKASATALPSDRGRRDTGHIIVESRDGRYLVRRRFCQ